MNTVRVTQWLSIMTLLFVSEVTLSNEKWPDINFPPKARVELIAEESWVAGYLPMRIFEVTGDSRERGIFDWLAADWLRDGQHCLLDAKPLKTLDEVPATPIKKTKILSCIIDEHIVVGEFTSGLRESAIVSLSAPARAAQRPASATVRAIQSYIGGKVLSHDFSDFGLKQATTLAIEAKGRPDFVADGLSSALEKNNWQVERLRGLPGSAQVSRELVAVLRDERLLISVQPLNHGDSGVVVVIEKEDR